MLRHSFRAFGILSVCSAWAAATACSAPPTNNNNNNNNGGNVGVGGNTNFGGGNNGGGNNGGGLMVGVVGDGGGLNVNSGAFPAEPIYVDGTDANAATVFQDNPDDFSPGVCVFEPHLSDNNGPGALFPQNWLRPRFRWTGTGSETVWEIRLQSGSQSNDLRVYTTDTQWIMPQDLWETISEGVQDVDITVTVRGSGPSGIVGLRGNFRITPALAGGSMVFWGTESSEVEPGTSRLYGFTMGDEAVVNTMAAEDVTNISDVLNGNGADRRGEHVNSYKEGFEPGEPRCIGCHSATPDGTAMAFTDDYPWNMGLASVEDGSTGTSPAYLTDSARQLMKIPFLGTAAMLPSPWNNGDRTMITTMGRREGDYIYINYDDKPEPTVHDLIWIDLEATTTIPTNIPPPEGSLTVPWSAEYSGSERQQAALEREEAILAAQGSDWGILTSETGSIANPAPSKTGLRLAYSVSDSSSDGHPDWHSNSSDIKTITLQSPRAASSTGTALQGASDPNLLEYYPAFSPDDQFIAFNRAPAPSNPNRCKQNPNEGCDNATLNLGENPDGPYYNRKGEVYVVPSSGGNPHRLRGNDPVACSGETSPGVINSWPKWSSAVREHNGKKYYFVIFSSARAYPNQFKLPPTEYTPPIDTRSSQLYMSVVEHDPNAQTLKSYAGIYLWNQNYLSTGNGEYTELKTSNMTPAWEDFSIPEVPPVVVVK